MCCFCSALYAQQFETGVIIDSIPVANSSNETFALYLPKAYEPNKLSPILFIFSPSGNGKEGVETFVKAAETYNHILVCSNNSRNGPLDLNFAISQRIFTHVFSNFKISENRVYLAGFSGGSRMATALATASDQINGVIACGAGFPPVPFYVPSKQKFSYAGLCGDRDMNYREMIGVKSYLDSIKFNNTLFTFDGTHKWPPNKPILMAFAWLETQAHKKGYLKKTNEQIKTSYLKNLGRAKTAMKNKQPLLAVEHYERALKTYDSFFNLDSVRQEFQNIKKNSAYTSAVKSREKAFQKEEVLSITFINRFKRDYEKPKKSNLKWWEKEFEKLNKKEAKADAQMRKMIERLRFKVMAMAYSRVVYERRVFDKSKSKKNQEAFAKAIILRLYPKANK